MSDFGQLSKAFQAVAIREAKKQRIHSAMLPLTGGSANWTASQTLRAYSQDGTLAALVDLIVDACLEPQWSAHKPTGKVNLRALLARKDIRRKTIKKSFAPLPEHEILDMLDRDTLRLVLLHWVLVGETFLYVRRNAAGIPVSLVVIPPNYVSQIPSEGQPYYHVSYETIQGMIRPEDMAHIVRMDPLQPLQRGKGLGQAASADLAASNAVNRTLNAVFSRGGVPAGLLAVDTGPDGDDDPEILADLEKRIQANHQGPDQQGKIAVVNGKVTGASLGVSLREQETVLASQHLTERIRLTYRVPSILLGNEAIGSRAQVESARYHFSQFVIEPLLENIRHQLQTRLVPLIDSSVVLDYEDVTPESTERVMSLMTNATTAPAFGLNDVRELAGYAKDPKLEGVNILPPPGAKPLDTDK